ncbi:crotonobetainyl-CoA:carnitine CoA-transferase CaiB-like acyl-CoA transferase [Mycolicibacterium mucogenicum 261Sha1.1M5]|nr:crotonobetainyl-CoA:carnitine CoA-transferase CaiB-like acyl-CoA transferase [Mycolicibacterium mucogenicum 261Sha1.1M5]
MQSHFGSLDGLRVVDLSRVLAGPLCTQILGDHGAEIIKVEPPAGDDTRRWGPPFVGEGSSAYYESLNRNKRNVCLDLKGEPGQAALRRLLDNADVLVENFRQGTLASWGLSDETIRSRWQRLVHCRITGFGADGPRGGSPGYDAVAQALGGLMSINGESAGPPLKVGVPIVDMVTGLYAVSGIMFALHERERSGSGQLIDLALFDTAVSLLHPHSSSWLADGTEARRTGSAHPTIQPYDTFAARDGQIFIAVGNDDQFERLCHFLNLPSLLQDPRFTSNGDRVRNQLALKEALSPALAVLEREHLDESFRALGIPAGNVQTVSEALQDAQAVARSMVLQVGGRRAVGIPIKLSRTPGAVVTLPHAKGQDTEEVLGELARDGDPTQ